MTTLPARRGVSSPSDAPGARHVTRTEYEGKGKHRWHCSCGLSGKKSYEMKTTAAGAGWSHERARNGRPA